MSIPYTVRCTTQAWTSMCMHTPWDQRVLGNHQVAHFLSSFVADSVTFPWIRWCHPYWLMRYRKILGHRCQYLKHCSTYEQHSITCAKEKHGNMNTYHIGLTNWTINVVWLNPKALSPNLTIPHSMIYTFFIHEIGKHINVYHNGIKCIP